MPPSGIFFQSRLALADVYLLFGPPDQSWFRPGNPAHALLPVHTVYYESHGLQLSSTIHCPLRLDNIWRNPAELSFVAVPSLLRSADRSALYFPMAGASWQRSSPVC